MSYVKVIHESSSFANAWRKALQEVIASGTDIKFGDKKEPKNAREIDCDIVLEGTALKEAIEGKLHPSFPTKELVKEAYLKQWERDFDWEKQGFKYNYNNRCCKHPVSKHLFIDGESHIDQWELAREDIWLQKVTGISSNRTLVLVGNVTIDWLEIHNEPPCLICIWIRYEGDNKISVKALFRSRDLYNAWMTNVVGLLRTVIREIAIPTGCEIVQYVDKNFSLHIYSGDLESASKVKNVGVGSFFPSISSWDNIRDHCIRIL